MTDEEKKAKEAAEKAEADAKAAQQAAIDKAVGSAVEKAIAKARKDVLAEIGVDDPAKAKSAVEAEKKAEEARLTESEKTQKVLKEALDGRGAAEAKLKEAEAKAKADIDAANERARKAEFFADTGVKPGDRIIVSALLDAAKGADPKLDEKAWAAGLKKERPYLFGEAPPPADTSTALPGAAGAGGVGPAAGSPLLPIGAPPSSFIPFAGQGGHGTAFIPPMGGFPAYGAGAPPVAPPNPQGFNALAATPQQVAEMRRQVLAKRP